MKLGILSDTHNNVENTRRALAIFQSEGAAHLVHCGDVTSQKMIEEFVGWRINFVYGNGDDRMGLRLTVKHLLPEASIDEQWSTEIDGVRLAAMHGDDTRNLDGLIRSGSYAYVFRGHSHIRLDERIGATRVINPGSLGGKRPQTRSICLLDLPGGSAKFIEID